MPSRKGPWWFVSRTDRGSLVRRSTAGAPAPRRPPSRSSSTRTSEARDQAFFEVGAFDVSQDHRLLAWSADLNGHEVFTLRVRDLDAGVDLPDVIEGTYYGTAWSADGRHLFYTVPDHAMRPHQVWRHELGTAQSDDVLVHQEDDERYNVDLGLTRSGEWIVITNECYDLHGRPRPPGGRRARRAAARRRPGSRTSSTGSTTGATGSSSSPTSTRRTSRS